MTLLAEPSIQLYTVRDSLRANPAGTLHRLASIGYQRVEPFSLLDFADALGRPLAENGLTAPSAHARLLDGRHKETFEAAAKLGIGTVIDPKIDESRWTSRDGIAAIADDLARVAEDAAEFGVRVGYHNHAFELSTRIEGTAALEVFATHLAPSIILEVDTYWAAVGGEDPVALLQRLGKRVRFLHLKDGPISNDNSEQVAVGSGQMPVAALIEAAPALEVGIVELDDFAGDVWQPVAASYRYLVGA